MKTAGFFGTVFLLSTLFVSAQSESHPTAPPTLTATNRLQRVFGPTATVEGVFPEVRRRGSIFNGLDLREPIVPGKEFRNISINPHTGRPQGVVLIAVRF